MIAQHIFTSPSPLLKLFYCAPFFIHFWQSCITPAVQCHIKWPCYYHQCSGEEKWPTLLLLRKHCYSKASNKHGLSFSWGSNGNNKPGDDIDYNRQPFELRLASICFSAFLIFQYLFKTSGFFLWILWLFFHIGTHEKWMVLTLLCAPHSGGIAAHTSCFCFFEKVLLSSSSRQNWIGCTTIWNKNCCCCLLLFKIVRALWPISSPFIFRARINTESLPIQPKNQREAASHQTNYQQK